MNELLRQLLNLPPQSSSVARNIDYLHYSVIIVTMLGASFVALLAFIFVIRYRSKAKRGDSRPRDESKKTTWGGTPLWLEGAIVGGLLSLFFGWWVIGFRQYVELRSAPEDSLEIYVTAKKWMWSFAYPQGGGSNAVLYVPVNRPVKLIMSSRDVIHSFYVPEFRIKQDVVPGHTTTVWFEVLEPGSYQILCTEYCGTGHSTMRGQVIALDEADYERHLEGERDLRPAGPNYEPPARFGNPPREAISLAATGNRVAAEHGCLRCHTLDGTPHIGPTWANLYGATITLEDGARLIADEAYMTESMMDPLAHVRRGFDPVMPSYRGQLTATDTAAIIELIKSLRRVERSERDPLPEGELGPEGEIELEIPETEASQ